MASSWISTAKPKTYPALDGNINVDVAIIGGSIAGTTALYELARAGANVALIDKGTLVESTTAFTTAFVCYVVDSRLTELRELFGDEKAKAVWESSRQAVEKIAATVEREKIDCEFMRCPFFLYGNDADEWNELAADVELARTYGFPVEERHDGDLQPRNAGYIEVPDQVKFHPLKYLDVLRVVAVEEGGHIYEKTEATALEGTGPFHIRTTRGNLTARKVLVATYDPFNKPAQLFAHKGIYTTYVLEMRVKQGLLEEKMYEDGHTPYHYLRVDAGRGGRGYDRVIFGGEDHRHELPLDPARAHAALEEYFQEILPGVPYKVVRRWSGPIIETVDGLPFIGTYDPDALGLFVATGFSGNGMTFGTMAGYMFSEFAQDKTVPWEAVYDPKRKITASRFWEKGKDYAEEFIGGYLKTVTHPKTAEKPRKE